MAVPDTKMISGIETHTMPVLPSSSVPDVCSSPMSRVHSTYIHLPGSPAPAGTDGQLPEPPLQDSNLVPVISWNQSQHPTH